LLFKMPDDLFITHYKGTLHLRFNAEPGVFYML